ncbi:MAG: hypothetical protein AB7U61_05540 [Methylocystis sp.]
MTYLSQATIPQLWLRIQRMRLAPRAFRLSRALRDLGEALTPDDLRRRL